MDSTCRICGRRLSRPESVKREMGPTCWTRLTKETKKKG